MNMKLGSTYYLINNALKVDLVPPTPVVKPENKISGGVQSYWSKILKDTEEETISSLIENNVFIFEDQVKELLKVYPNINSKDVTIPEPIIPCQMIPISQGITSFINPIRTKHNPPKRNIEKAVCPLNPNSIRMYIIPPLIKRIVCFKKNFIYSPSLSGAQDAHQT